MSEMIRLNKIRDLIGENPQQKASLYETDETCKASLLKAERISGGELSFNDIVDIDMALALIREFPKEEGISVVMFHHSNPCSVAISENALESFCKAKENVDDTSMIEGILVINDIIDKKLAEKINEMYLHVVVALDYTKEATENLKKQEQLSVLKHPGMMDLNFTQLNEVKSILGGLLIQDYNLSLTDKIEDIASRKATYEERKQLLIAYKVVKHTKSNAIVLVKDNSTVGIGPGANNRIWATKQAIERAKDKAKGSVMASDAIIPLCESVDLAGKAGISAIIQPGGWFKENENIQVANKYNMAMLTTGINQFKH